jgi:hypothetical protein
VLTTGGGDDGGLGVTEGAEALGEALGDEDDGGGNVSGGGEGGGVGVERGGDAVSAAGDGGGGPAAGEIGGGSGEGGDGTCERNKWWL